MIDSDQRYTVIGYSQSEFSDSDVWVIKYETDPTLANDPNPLIPLIFDLGVYPNPFNGVTGIKYSVPEPQSGINISVYDILGHEVAVLVNQKQDIGEYYIVWEAEVSS